MNKCMCLRVSDDTRYLITQIGEELGYKTQSAFLNEFFYFVSRGKNFPGSNIDMRDFLSKVQSGEFTRAKSIADKVQDLEEETMQQYISILEEEYGDTILKLIATDGIKKLLDTKHSRWMLNIQHTLMDRCDIGLLEYEVKNLCLQWYNTAKRDGKISKLQKEIISAKWDKMENSNSENTLLKYSEES